MHAVTTGLCVYLIHCSYSLRLPQSRSKTTSFGLVEVEVEKPEDYKTNVNSLKTTGRVSPALVAFYMPGMILTS